MIPDRPSAAPDFTLRGIRFQCWITDAGQRFEWRSICGRFVVGRLGPRWWARAEGRDKGSHHATPRAAMEAALFRMVAA